MSTNVKVETWQNVGRGRVVVLKFDRNGDVRHEMVRGGQKFTITSEERLLNMDRAAKEELDVFKNGFLTPVRLLDDAEDYQEIASNPNLLSEAELTEMFNLQWKAFEFKVNNISNSLTLERLAELAESEDVNVTHKQFQVIKARLAEVLPASRAVEATVEQIGHVRGGEGDSKGVTPQ